MVAGGQWDGWMDGWKKVGGSADGGTKALSLVGH